MSSYPDPPHPAQPPHPPQPPQASPPPTRHRGRVLAALTLAVGLLIGLALSWTIENRRPAASVGTRSSTLDLAQLEAQADPAIVDIVSTLSYQNGQSAGTGIVLTSSGEVLTNNHVIDGATSIRVTDLGNGRTYTATIVGYDESADLAVLQLKGASGLQAANLGDSSAVAIGESVVALGNAGGVGGTPSAATGTVTALAQTITASDEGTGSSERLSGLIQTDAALQPGDSGGPLLNTKGQVIGIDTAASSGFAFQSGAATGESYAIPINTAISIAKQIEAGHSSSTVHIGTTAFLGVEINGAAVTSSGAVVAGVVSGSPADGAGFGAGDVIVAVGGQTVGSATQLSEAMSEHHPGDRVSLTWLGSDGQQHSATVTLVPGPAA